MIVKKLTIINRLGLHARAAAKFVAVASKHNCEIEVCREERVVNGKSIMGIMMLAASQGSDIEVRLDGSDEDSALLALENLIDDRFGETE